MLLEAGDSRILNMSVGTSNNGSASNAKAETALEHNTKGMTSYLFLDRVSNVMVAGDVVVENGAVGRPLKDPIEPGQLGVVVFILSEVSRN